MSETKVVEAEDKSAVQKVTSIFKGYIDGLMDKPFHHITTATIAMGVGRRVTTSALKKELGEPAYKKVMAKIPLGSIPLVNA